MSGSKQSASTAAGAKRKADVTPASLNALGESHASVKGLRAVIESRVINHERLPMLDAVFERFTRSFSTAMRNLTFDAVEISTEDLTSVRFADFMSQLPSSVVIGVVHVPAWANYGLATADSNLVYAVIDSLLGGRRSDSAQVGGRGFTNIDISLVSRVFRLAFAELSVAFQPIAPIEMSLDRMETNPKYASIATPGDTAALARMRIDMEGRGGMLSILLPYSTLEPVRSQLVQRFMGEKTGSSSIWQEHMERELNCALIDVELVLGEKEIPIETINNFQVGQTLSFGVAADDLLELRSRGVSLGLGHIGQRAAHIAVRMATALVSKPAAHNGRSK
jgi:flagellar motor switch protein FliM